MDLCFALSFCNVIYPGKNNNSLRVNDFFVSEMIFCHILFEYIFKEEYFVLVEGRGYEVGHLRILTIDG